MNKSTAKLAFRQDQRGTASLASPIVEARVSRYHER